MSQSAAYRCTPTPACAAGEPLPATVYRPSTKSVGCAGSGSGSQRSCSGVTGPLPKSLWRRGWSNGAKPPCIDAGRIRYSQLRRFCARGAVKAVPEICSAYSPWATRCGEFWPSGSVPGMASLANSLPKPVMYCSSVTAFILVRPCKPLPLPERGFPVLLSEDPAPHLVALDALEQRLEVALAEAFVALALNDLEEDRADRVLGEDLQQLALLGLGIRVDQDPVAAQALHVLAVLRDALVDHVEVRVGRVQELDAGLAHLLHRHVDVVGEAGDVLDAFAVVRLEVFVDLRLGIGRLVERDAHHAVRRGHGLGEQAGLGALDVEVADLAEVEQPFVVVRPLGHVALVEVVGQVVYEGHVEACRLQFHALLVHVVGGVVRALGVVTVD